ncbi:MAG: LysM peptidoglycan-binding domain-containing protein [bacterium]|nr:LysM peptidoglycan-binding domain-containing protein [bacterium]
MKRVLVLVMISLLTLGLLGTSGCSKKTTRQADVATGDYYTQDEYDNLGKEQAEEYCAELASELERLAESTADLKSGNDDVRIDQLKRQLATVQSRHEAQRTEVEQIRGETNYFESLPGSYEVVKGDCLWWISAKEAIYADPVKWPRIYRANRDQIKDPDLIYPGQVFAIPRDWPKQHKVVRGEWLAKIAGYWEIYDDFREWPKIYEANRDQINDPDLIYPDQVFEIPR